MDQREGVRFTVFVTLAPLGGFFGALALLSLFRGTMSWHTAEDGIIGLVCTGAAVAFRPRSGGRQAIRLVLGLLGILAIFAAATVIVYLVTGSLALGGIVYLAGWGVEVGLGAHLVRRLAPFGLPRTGSKPLTPKSGD